MSFGTKAPVQRPEEYCLYESDGDQKWWTSDATAEHKLQTSAEGAASLEQTPQMTLPELFKLASEKHANDPAVASEMLPPWKEGDPFPAAKPRDQWTTLTWKEYYEQSKLIAKAFISLGLSQFDSVAIFATNSPSWTLAFWGSILAGGKTAGIYPTDSGEIAMYKIDHSNSAVAVVQNLANLDKIQPRINALPYLKAIVCLEEDPGENLVCEDGRIIQMMSWEALNTLGDRQDDTLLLERLAGTRSGHCATLIYTSGTTSFPKAVMLCHDSFVSSAQSIRGARGKTFGKANERGFSYLALSHLLGQFLDVVYPMIMTSNILDTTASSCTYFSRPYDLKKGLLIDRLKAVQPTFFTGVPRIFEKIMEKLTQVDSDLTGIKKAVLDFAKSQSAQYIESHQVGSQPVKPLLHFLSKPILGKIAQKLGLDQCTYVANGAAPVSYAAQKYFASIGISVLDAFGMSEAGIVSISSNTCYAWGSCGFEAPGIEVKVLGQDGAEVSPTKNLLDPSEEEQGEICIRGRSIMMGYLANPRLGEDHVKEIEQKNADTIDLNGFLHSGDKGTIDERGMLRICGRYKELIITAGGKNIAPVPIEDRFKVLCPAVSNAIMIGDKRKFNVMLLTLKTEGATGELPGTGTLISPASEVSKSKTVSEAIKEKEFIEVVQNALEKLNEDGTVVLSNAAKVQKFSILPRDFSISTDELTPTLKLRRSVVEKKHWKLIDAMYASEDVYVEYKL